MTGAARHRRDLCLRAMGLTVWTARDAPRSAGSPAEPAVETDDVAAMEWPALERVVSDCTRCGLHRSRTHTVFGVGARRAEWMVIGEAPGREEDRRGEPFVGRAGKLLDAMLAALDLSRETVFIANVLKCRPPSNRDPTPEEAAACAPFLNRQITLLRPRIILAVGRIAAHRLLETENPLARLRGRVHRHEATGTPVVVTYHPAYLLRSPAEKRKAWTDLLLARSVATGSAAL